MTHSSDIPAEMTVAEVSRPGGPEVLVLGRRAVPTTGVGELLVKIAAVGVNRADVSLRSGATQPPPGASDLPGLEVSGEVAALGAGVQGWRVGDRCMALLAFGGYAEYCAVPAVQCLPVPAGLDLVHAAAVMETFITVWSNVVQTGRLKAGDWLLVHGGGSGIGTTAIQVARALGAHVIVTAGDDSRCAACRDLGADVAVNHRTKDFVAAVMEATDGRGVDVLLDVVGGDYLDRNIAAMAVDGRLVMIALLRGAATQVNLLPLILKRVVVTGALLKTRTPEEKGAIAAEMRARLFPLFENGSIRPIVEDVFALAQAAEAHRRIEAPHFGKFVLTT